MDDFERLEQIQEDLEDFLEDDEKTLEEINTETEKIHYPHNQMLFVRDIMIQLKIKKYNQELSIDSILQLAEKRLADKLVCGKSFETNKFDQIFDETDKTKKLDKITEIVRKITFA